MPRSQTAEAWGHETGWPPPSPTARPAVPRKVEAEIQAITKKPRVRRVVTWQLDGGQPKDLRLTWGTNEAARRS
jgi:hypothetical protein